MRCFIGDASFLVPESVILLVQANAVLKGIDDVEVGLQPVSLEVKELAPASHKLVSQVTSMSMQVRNAAPSVTSSDTVSTRPLLPVLDTAPSVPSAACVAVGPQPSVRTASHAKPIAAVTLPSSQVDLGKARSASKAVPAQATAHRQSARLSVLPDVTANITMATKDAFACVNAMFGSSLSHAPNVTCNLAQAVEPTVTISTRAAFEELNSMFSSDLPHHRAQFTHTSRAIDSRRPGCTIGTAAPRAARQHLQGSIRTAGSTAANATAQLGLVRSAQPTAFVKPTGLASQAAVDTGGFAIYEDTNVLPSKPCADQTAGFAVYEDTGFIGEQPQHQLPADVPQGFQIYEDTQCLQAKPNVNPPSDSFQIQEDTECLQRHQGDTSGAAQGSPTGFGIYEDTQFVNSAVPAPARQSLKPAVMSRAQLASPVAHSPGGFGIYEDTQFVSKAEPAQHKTSSKATQRHRPSPVKDEENVVYAEDKENCSGPARCENM